MNTFTVLVPQAGDNDRQVIAIVEDQSLIQYRVLSEANTPAVGDLVLGKIVRIQRNLSAAFVDIGLEKHAFMPMDAVELDSMKNGTELIAEVKKDAVENKGMTVTSHYSLRSEHVVLSYGNTLRGVSKKITDEDERKRLKTIVFGFPEVDNVGFILRTEAAGVNETVLTEEAHALVKKNLQIRNRSRYSKVGTRLSNDGKSLAEALTSFSSGKVEKIVVEDPKVYSEAKEALLSMSPEKAILLRLYDKDTLSLSAVYRLESQLREALAVRVNLSGPGVNGGYLFIEETHACSVIDVNTGKELSGSDKEEAVTEFNIACCKEIVRQIMLRNLSGMILIDFVNMENGDHRDRVVNEIMECLKKDPRQTNVLGFTALGLLEMTRQRKGPTLAAQLNSTK